MITRSGEDHDFVEIKKEVFVLIKMARRENL